MMLLRFKRSYFCSELRAAVREQCFAWPAEAMERGTTGFTRVRAWRVLSPVSGLSTSQLLRRCVSGGWPVSRVKHSYWLNWDCWINIAGTGVSVSPYAFWQRISRHCMPQNVYLQCRSVIAIDGRHTNAIRWFVRRRAQ